MSFNLRPIEPSDTEVAQNVATNIRVEFIGDPEKPASRGKSNPSSDLCDIEEAEKRYLGNKGMFYVMTDRGRVIGTGAVKHVTDEVCELRHLNFLRPYRGRGLGEEMAISLIEWAREHSYETVRLTAHKNQFDAHKLLRKLGFVATVNPAKTSEDLTFELDLYRKSRKPR